MPRKNFRERRKLRREEAEARQVLRDKRTDAQQIGWLDDMGHIACKERDRLANRMLKGK